MNDLIKVLLSGAACAALGQPALAQRASENAVANADDAFGSNVGLETTGIYSDQDTRGFSPVKAGNARIDGIYYDPVGSISGRMRMGTAIRVGFASEEYPFHAPTGIADYRFRPFPDADGLSLSHTTMAFGGVIQEADLRLALDPGRIGFTGGVARADLKMSDGSRNASWGYAFRPFFRFGGMEFAPFTSGANFHTNYAHPLIVVRGSDLPDLPRKRRFLGQKWAEGSYRNRLHGATLRGNMTDRLSLRAGLFRAEGPRQQNYAELFGYTSDAQPLSHRVVSDPVQDIHSTSGEALLAWRVGGGRIDSRVFAGFRGRNRLTETGGSGVADLAPFTGWDVRQVARPAFTYGPVNAGRVKQQSWMAGYVGKLSGVGSVNLGLQRARYVGTFRPGGPGAASRGETQAWLYNATVNIHVARKLSVYLGSERGLEDSGVAPESAANRNEQLPATLTRQYEGGVRWKFKGGQLVLSAFEISKPYFTFDAVNDFTRQGKVRHRGLEASLSGRFGDRLNLVAGAIAMQPRVTGAARDAGLVGSRPPGTPSLYARLDANYRTDLLGGLTPTLAVIHTGERAVTARPQAALGGRQLMLDPVTTVDIGVRRQFKAGKVPMSARFVLINAFDKAVWKVAAPNIVYPEERRRINFAIAADF